MATPPVPSGFDPTVTTSRTGGSFEQRGGSRNVFWRPSRELAKKVMALGEEQVGTPIQYFPGSTARGTAPYLSQGLQGLYQRASMGSPVTGAAEQLGTATLQGQYLNPQSNPYLRQYYQMGARDLGSEYQNVI